MIPIEQVLGSADVIDGSSRVEGEGPAGRLPLTPSMLREAPSGNLFGLTQNVGMGWSAARARRPAVRDRQHAWAACAARTAARSRSATTRATGRSACSCARPRTRCVRAGAMPFAGYCSDPVRRPHAGHDRHVRQPGLPQRRGDRDAPTDPVAAHGERCAGHRDLRQGTAGDDARAGGLRSTARRDRAGRRHAAGRAAPRMRDRCRVSARASRTI